MTARARAGRNQKSVNLALQGGGAHGAFAWGVLDRLLEDGRLDFEGVTATSAGAMNAAVLAHGLTQGGRDGARGALEDFWRRVSASALFSPLKPTPFEEAFGNGNPPIAHAAFDMMTRLVSPYQFNPLNFNPLRDIVEDTVDFEALRRNCAVRLFLCATNVHSGKVRVFTDADVTADAVMASGCLPFLFQAVEIDGEAYWDGGYMGNPALFPLIYNCESRDIVIVHINPLTREEIPKDATSIMNRLNEISFNSSLMREMRAIAFVTNMIDNGTVSGRDLKRMLIHSIEAEEFMLSLGVASKLNPDWQFLTHLRDVGRNCAEEWLADTFEVLGEESSVDIRAKYL